MRFMLFSKVFRAKISRRGKFFDFYKVFAWQTGLNRAVFRPLPH